FARRSAALERACPPERQRERLLRQELGAEVGLRTRVRDAPATVEMAEVRDDAAAEQRQPRRRRVERGRTRTPEAERRQVDVEHPAREVGARDVVERHAREAAPLAVVLRVLVVDAVVAERAEKEVREW